MTSNWLRFTKDWRVNDVNDLCPRKGFYEKQITPDIILDCLRGRVKFSTHAITKETMVLPTHPTMAASSRLHFNPFGSRAQKAELNLS
jgi:hypothetical protein